ncbi:MULTISPECIES: rpoE leader peptide RseD [Pseudocitrobacter]|nr:MULTISPECIES: rpoE leader peptide RseD [Pseudocitrobacter]KAA1046438.1 rpoE leader peptide RseD [Pseudocitrobacter sp. 73]MDF3830282.1 rpoE leader peptide RseD [Pseudocitrobacter sp. 2023EL-00150]MEC5375237.1 rpoE leader peptide RseD [Pseudocitrobacter sp. MW920760]UYW74052.1 rpoE leader peptide RseD [Pseudocitrobacter faecalis]
MNGLQLTNKKQRRNGTLQSSDTLTLCLLIVQ